MSDLRGKIVEVGTGETTYVGKLVEMNEDEIYMESEMGWIVVPVEKVVFMREKEE